MRKFLLLALPLFLLSVPASAQDDLPLIDLFVGGGYLGVDAPTGLEDALGAVVDVNVNINEKYGLFFSFGYHEALDVDAAVYEDLGGIRYFFRNEDSNKTFFVHAMGGGVEIDGPTFNTGWAVGGGIGMDMPLHDKFDFRVFQLDYVASFVGGDTQNNIRVSTGIIFHFGSR